MTIDLIDAVGLLSARQALVQLNLVGAILLFWSLWYCFNLAAFVLEVVWAGIAVVGLAAALSKPSPLQGRGLGEGKLRDTSDCPLPPTPSAEGEGEL